MDAYESYGNLQRLVEAAKTKATVEPVSSALTHATASLAAFERALQESSNLLLSSPRHVLNHRPRLADPAADASPEIVFDMPSRTQKGLIKPIDNSEGRRIKAVYMSGDDLAAVLASKAFALGLCAMAGKLHKMQRIRSKLMAVGANALAKRMKQIRKVAIKMFSFTVLMRLLHAFEKARRTRKLLLVGSMTRCIKTRNRHQTALNAVMLGFLIRADKRQPCGVQVWSETRCILWS
jgi:hypothetical protein